MDLLSQIPLEVGIRSGSDEGVPIVISNPDSFVSQAYANLAKNVVGTLEDLAKKQYFRPEITL